MTLPHKSIPSPRSIASVIHGSPPQINSIAPIQLRAPWNTPINQSHNSHPASVAPPWRAPTNQSHLFDPVASPWRVPASVKSQWRAPSNQSHLPNPVVCPHYVSHKSILLPRSSPCCMPHGTPPWINPITLIQPVSCAPWQYTAINQTHCPAPASVACPHETIPSPRSSQCHIQSGAPMTRPCKSTPSPWYSQCRMPPWHTS